MADFICGCKTCVFYDEETENCNSGKNPKKDNDPIMGCWGYEPIRLRRGKENEKIS